jgi:hypothetical protein
MADEGPQEFTLEVDWQLPPETVAQYATNFLIQAGEKEFFLYFFQVRPPLVVGTPEQQRTQLSELNLIPAQCIASIIISKERMPEFVQIMQDHVRRHVPGAFGEEEEEEEAAANG